MKHVSFISVARLLATLLAWCSIQAATAAPLVSLKGTTDEIRDPSDNELRLSILGFDEGDSVREAIERFREYQADGDHAAFSQYLRSRQTRGYIFGKEATGYSIKYAWQDPERPTERMVLVVTPALKTLNPYLWKSRNESEAPFSVVELRMQDDRAIMKTSLDSTVGIGEAGDRLYLENYDEAGVFATLEDNTPYYLKEQSLGAR